MERTLLGEATGRLGRAGVREEWGEDSGDSRQGGGPRGSDKVCLAPPRQREGG